jgi:hypothetical protein
MKIAAAVSALGAIAIIQPANASTFNFDYTFASGETIFGTVEGDADNQGLVSLNGISLIYSGYDSVTFDQLNFAQASNELKLDKSFIDVSATASGADDSDFSINFDVNQVGAAGVTLQVGGNVVQDFDFPGVFSQDRLNISLDGNGGNPTTPEPTATIGLFLVGGLVWGKLKRQQIV